MIPTARGWTPLPAAPAANTKTGANVSANASQSGRRERMDDGVEHAGGALSGTAPSGGAPSGVAPSVAAPEDGALDGAEHAGDAYLDPRDADTRALLAKRTPGGGYAIGDAALVRGIRAADARADTEAARELAGMLVTRCLPEFQRRAWGLRHRPELMEDAIANMIEQLLREARDPHEIFMTQNFIHYLRCLCADNFTRVLRQEGLSYRRDAEGRPAGRPQHVPRALVERLEAPPAASEEGEAGAAATVADPRDAYEERLAAIEAQRILGFLADPLDRQIVTLRVMEHLQWEEIATLCGKTERTMRLRFEKARQRMREGVEAEAASVV